MEADPSQVEQVLVNLAVNARDAMPGGGRLEIELANEDTREQVRLTVRDSGHGMSPEVIERAFEPFYSTKPKGQGTGLGLATVYGIVTQAGGSVRDRLEPGEGTAVNVLLPATAAKPDDALEPRGRQRARAGGETILVVEDEDAVRRLTCRILSRQGYRVLEAPDGHHALDTWDEHGSEIDLLLTDVVMPGMSGKELAEQIGIEPVFMSGYTDDVVLRHGVEGLRLVQKPFDAETLLARRALGARRRPGLRGCLSPRAARPRGSRAAPRAVTSPRTVTSAPKRTSPSTLRRSQPTSEGGPAGKRCSKSASSL